MVSPDTHQELVSSYAEHFVVVRADTPTLLNEAFRLRYQVYCLENNGFESPDEHPDGLERDGDDDRSVHALLMHRLTGTYAGTVRVILPTKNGLMRPLPMHGLLEAQDNKLLMQLPPAGALAEISRFAVSKEFRRRRGEERYADAEAAGRITSMSDERRALPYITFGLISAVLEICQEQRVPWIAAVMEPALIRIFQRFGVHFDRVGAPVEHHGMRWCSVARLADLVHHGQAHGTPLSLYTRRHARRSPKHMSRTIADAA